MYQQTVFKNIHPNRRFGWHIPSQLLLVCAITCFTAPRQLQAADGDLGNGNTAEGKFALNAIATNSANIGTNNTAIGNFALGADTSGSFNTASGTNGLGLNTTGSNNTATGFDALFNNNADNNTATGFKALLHNTTGTGNTATGYFALSSNNGNNNTAHGFSALSNNTSGSGNTGDGLQALASNMVGDNNTALGFNALVENSAGNNNVAAGVDALASNDTGSSNTAIGIDALLGNTSGSNNIAVGNNGGINLTTGNRNIDIGNAGKTGESNAIRIGDTQKSTFIAGIAGTAMSGMPVVVTSGGKLGVGSTSSLRFKDAVKPMDKTSETILALKPVSFRYKQDVDPHGIPQFGLIAEEVEKIAPDLVTRDEEGKPYGVRYDAVNAMLLNEFLKEHKQVQQLNAALLQQQGQFEGRIAQQQQQIELLTAGLQKLAAEVQLGKSTTNDIAKQR